MDFNFDSTEMKEMAAFVSELVKQGTTFKVFKDDSNTSFVIRLTGGF